MDFSQAGPNASRKLLGIVAVILLHVMIAYVLASGMARKVMDVIQQPLQARLIEEIKPLPPPPPPPPPPPDKPTPPPPRRMAPPPPFVPPPEVRVARPARQDAIVATTPVAPTVPEPAPVVKAPDPAPVQEVVPPPPRSEPVRIAAVVDASACRKPAYPRASQLAGETGVVILAFLIGVDGNVIDSRVEQSSGSDTLDRAARAGLSRCKFKPGSVDGKPEQSWMKMQFVWKLEG